MAKKSVINRGLRRERLVEKYATLRQDLKKRIIDPKLSEEEKLEARTALNKLPRDSSAVRLRNRCSLTGRPHGFYRKFGLGRNKLREQAMDGHIPGLTKASW